MNLVWTQQALSNLRDLHSYILNDNQTAATEVTVKIARRAEDLLAFPEMGRPGRVAGTRELVVSPFVIAYTARDESVIILAVYHGAQRWPTSFRDQ